MFGDSSLIKNKQLPPKTATASGTSFWIDFSNDRNPGPGDLKDETKSSYRVCARD